VPAGLVNSIADVFEIAAAQEKILHQTEDNGTISKRVETIAFKINDGN
jgi:hypothetical protein